MQFASKKVYFRKNSLSEEEEETESRNRLELSVSDDDLRENWSDASDDDEEEEDDHKDLAAPDMNQIFNSNNNNNDAPMSTFSTANSIPEENKLPELGGNRMAAPAKKKKSGGFLSSLFGGSRQSSEDKESVAAPSSVRRKEVREVKRQVKMENKIKKKAVGRPISEQKKFKTRVDFNIVSVKLACLKEESELATGDAVFCGECGAAFSCHSTITEVQKVSAPKEDEEEKKMDVDEGAGAEKAVPIMLDDTWVCEFCAHSNEANLEEEEKPKSNKTNYILESVAQVQEKHEDDDISILFCIDISGSMCVTQAVQGKLKFKGDKKDDWAEMNRNFGDGSMQFMPHESKDITYVSRLQCVKAAIESQILEMAHAFPNRRIGILTFNSEVSVLGDGSQNAHVITGDKLSKYDVCKQEGSDLFKAYMAQNIEATKDQLISKLDALEETGPTALGPALLTATAMASKGKAGSQVIICTDGLANVGLGSLEGQTEAEVETTLGFYRQVGDLAEDNNVKVSVISILGEECKLTALSDITERTNGDVIRVNPENLTQEFSNILSNSVIATQVVVKLMLHRGLKFRNEEEHDLNENETVMTRKLGNVNEDTEFTFEYSKRTTEELTKAGIDVENLQNIPFQTQINYTTLDGMKCIRVITEMVELSEKLAEVEASANIELLGVNAARQASKLAKKGDYRAAQATAHNWKVQLDRVSENLDQRSAYNDFKHNMGQLHSDLNNIYEEEEAIGYGGANDDQIESSGMRQMRRNDSFTEKLSKATKMNSKQAKSRWSKK